MIKIHLSYVMILVSSLIAFSSVVADQAFAQARILQECGLKYQEDKAVGKLAGKNWQEFLRDCSTRFTIQPKHMILNQFKKGVPEHRQDPEIKDGKATGSVEPMPDYMRPFNELSPEKRAEISEHYWRSATPKSGLSATTPRSRASDKTPRYSIPEEDYQHGNLTHGKYAL